MEIKIYEADVIYVGDFNIWVDDIGNVGAQNFPRILVTFYLSNIVSKSTYNSGDI